MSTGRFIGAGFAAGALCCVLGFGFAHTVLGDEVEALLARHGPMPWWEPLLHLGLRLSFAFSSLWVLIATHARVRSLPRAITVATLVAWLLAYPVLLLTHHHSENFSDRALVLMGAWGVVELVLVLACGAWVLRLGKERAI